MIMALYFYIRPTYSIKFLTGSKFFSMTANSLSFKSLYKLPKIDKRLKLFSLSTIKHFHRQPSKDHDKKLSASSSSKSTKEEMEASKKYAPAVKSNSYSQAFVDECFDKDIRLYRKHQVVYIIRSASNKDCQFTLRKHNMRILEYFNTTSTYFTTKDVFNVMYSLGSLDYSRTEDIEALLSTLARLLLTASADKTNKCGAVDIAMAMYGLRDVNNHSKCNEILEILTSKFQLCDEMFTSQGLSNALHGLQNIEADRNPAVLPLLQELKIKILNSSDAFTDQSLRLAFTGLRSLDTKHMEVRKLIKVLTLKLESYTGLTMTPTTVSGILHGLRNMSADYVEVRNLIRVINEKIVLCKLRLKSVQLTRAFTGLKNLKSNFAEVQQLIRILTPKLKLIDTGTKKTKVITVEQKRLQSQLHAQDQLLKAQELQDIIIGMQNFSSDNEAVRSLITVLTMKIQESSQVWRASQIGNIIHSLQNFHSDYTRVRKLVTAITEKVKLSQVQLSADDVSKALFGLINMKPFPSSIDADILTSIPTTTTTTSTITTEKFTEIDELIEQLLLKLPIVCKTTAEEDSSETNIELSMSNSGGGNDARANDHVFFDKDALTQLLYGLRDRKRLSINFISHIEQSIHSILVTLKTVSQNSNSCSSEVKKLLLLYQSLLFNMKRYHKNGDGDTSNNDLQDVFSQLTPESQTEVNELMSHLSELFKNFSSSTSTRHDSDSINSNNSDSDSVEVMERILKNKYVSEYESQKITIERNVMLYGFECDLLVCWKSSDVTHTSTDDDATVTSNYDSIINYQSKLGNFCGKDTQSTSTPSLVQSEAVDDSDTYQPMIANTLERMRDEYLNKIHNIQVVRY